MAVSTAIPVCIAISLGQNLEVPELDRRGSTHLSSSFRDPEWEKAADLLSEQADYRVLRRLLQSDMPSQSPAHPTIGVVVDVETTGLDHDLDEVIELAMIKFTFDREGSIGGLIDEFSSVREPGVPIPAKITELTGITADAVAGKEIDPVAVSQFLGGANLVIAHNAAFDRPFCERLWPIFRDMAWACSATQIDWASEGVSGTRLEYILVNFDRFYSAHRAIDDCAALLFALCHSLPKSGATPFEQLLRNARKAQARVYAVGASYELRLVLKKRGYRWNDGTDGFPRAWWRDIDLTEVDREKAFLSQLPESTPIEPFFFKLTARNRFRRALDW